MKISKNNFSTNLETSNNSNKLTKKDIIIKSTKKLVFTILLSLLPNNNNSLELKGSSFLKQESSSPEIISTTKQTTVNLNSFNDIFNNNCKNNNKKNNKNNKNAQEVIWDEVISSIECSQGILYTNPLTKIKNDGIFGSKYSIHGLYNKKLLPETNIIVNKLSNVFGLDIDIMKKLILHESQGKINAQSHANAKGIMQVLPSTVRDLWVRFHLYDDNIIKAGKTILPILKDGQLKIFLEQYILSNTQKRKHLLFQFETSLFDHDMNIFAGFMIFLEYINNASKQSEDLEKELYDTIVGFDELNFEKINSRRKNIGASPLKKDIFMSNFINYNNETSKKEYMVYLLALAGYNGGRNLSIESIRYSLVIGGSFFMSET